MIPEGDPVRHRQTTIAKRIAPPLQIAKYTWPGSNWRPSACEADVIATRPQVLKAGAHQEIFSGVCGHQSRSATEEQASCCFRRSSSQLGGCSVLLRAAVLGLAGSLPEWSRGGFGAQVPMARAACAQIPQLPEGQRILSQSGCTSGV